MDERTAAWAAGIFEGEGYISVQFTVGGRASATAGLGITDRDVIERWASAVGSYVLGPYERPGKPMYFCYVRGFDALRRIFVAFAPWLGVRRAARFREVLAMEPVGPGGNANRDKTHCWRGHEFTPANTYIRPSTDGGRRGRDCRQCARDRNRKARTVE